MDGVTHDGNWWLSLLQCEVIELSTSDHPRWQIDVQATGRSANMTELRAILSPGAIRTFESLATSGSKKVVRLQCHHVAYNADPARRVTAPIPVDVGAGASISHLCDRRGCIRAGHLETANEHITNLDRQRCRGAWVLVYRNTIIMERPCGHGRGENVEETLRNSCLSSLQVDVLTDESAETVAALRSQP